MKMEGQEQVEGQPTNNTFGMRLQPGVMRVKRYLPFDEIQFLITTWYSKRYDLTSRAKYRGWVSKIKPPGIPKFPEVTFDEQWVDWNTFLGTNNKFYGAVMEYGWRSYWDACRYVQSLNIPNSHTYRTMKRNNELPTDLPLYPEHINQYHPDWTGWDFWLGKTTHSQLEVMEQVVGVIGLCNPPDQPPNVISIVVERGGLDKFNENCVNSGMSVIKKYQWDESGIESLNAIVGRLCNAQGDGTYIVINMNQLVYELDNVLLWWV